MQRAVLLSTDPILAESARMLLADRRFDLTVLPSLPAGGAPIETFALAIVDVRAPERGYAPSRAVQALSLQPRGPLRAERVLCLGDEELTAGRMANFALGASGYLCMSAPCGADSAVRLSAALDDVLGLPPFRAIDTQAAFADRDFHRLLLESLPIPLVIVRPQGSIRLVNPAAMARFDCPAHLLIGQDWTVLVAERDRRESAPVAFRHIANAPMHECCLRFADRHGREFSARLTSSRVFSAQLSTTLIALTIQEWPESGPPGPQHLRRQRAETIERVLRSSAHEFGNLLTGLIGHAELLARLLPVGSQVQASAEIIRGQMRAAQRLADLLLDPAGGPAPSPRLVSCAESVCGVQELLRWSLGSRIRFETRLVERGDLVNADPIALQQVILNLCLNARDAIAGEGVISVQTSLHAEGDSVLDASGSRRPSAWVEIAVSDTGRGMDPAALQRARSGAADADTAGSGRGLGLCVVNELVRAHGGHVLIDSEEGRGTTVRVRLPSASAAPAELSSWPSAGGEACSVLLVDGDELSRAAARDALENAGYRVWIARNAPAALELFELHQTLIGLVVVDAYLPDGEAGGVVRDIRNLNGIVPIVLSIGPGAGAPDDELVQAVQGFLRKPYHPRELIELVREVTTSSPEDAAGSRESN